MARTITVINDDTFQTIEQAPSAVLILQRSDCDACHSYENEVLDLLESGELPVNVVGKMVLDEPGSAGFKQGNTWLQGISYVPYTVLYQSGEPVHRFAGSRREMLLQQVAEKLVRR